VNHLARFEGLKVVVLGDPVLDGFLTGPPTRLCSEQPVPVVLKSSEENRPGGAANTAANLRALGARVALLGLVGADAPGEALRSCLQEAGVAVDGLVVDRSRPTPHKLRILAGDHYVARVDSESSMPASTQIEQQLLERLEPELADSDVVVVSDYGLGSVSRASMRLASRAATREGRAVVLDAKDLLSHASAPVTVATPNWLEAHAVAGLPVPAGAPSECDLETLGRELLRRLNAGNVAVTRGAHGVVLFGRTEAPEQLNSPLVLVRNEVGAGDSLVAGLALSLAAGAPLRDAVRIGIESAAVAVTKPLTAIVSLAELSERLEVAGWETGLAPPGVSAQMQSVLSEARVLGRRIVFTNGVFDLLHEGHVSLLQRGRRLGDLLVVAVNSDQSASRLKGQGRPIHQLEERCALLAALDCVDLVIAFDGPTACNLVAAVRPDVYVKGEDHDLERVPEGTLARSLGARLVSIPHVRAVSTTQIIERVLGVTNVVS
jgi:D-beta-D-heptose 7-phosphate kinase/D-beta-D-heptose 1-phosphate adenosyltransferase